MIDDRLVAEFARVFGGRSPELLAELDADLAIPILRSLDDYLGHDTAEGIFKARGALGPARTKAPSDDESAQPEEAAIAARESRLAMIHDGLFGHTPGWIITRTSPDDIKAALRAAYAAGRDSATTPREESKR